MDLGKWLSKNDTLIMLEITNECLFCETERDYQKLIEKLNELIFFDHSISASVDMREISLDNMNSGSINNGYPQEYLEIYTNNKYHFIDPLYEQFGKTFEIQNSNELKSFYDKIPNHPIPRLMQDFGLKNTFLYGVCGANINPFTVFILTGERIKNHPRTQAIIHYIVPYLSLALQNSLSHKTKTDFQNLSKSELEVLKWLKEGKSSWEISIILNRSERSVNFHINNILNKLDAANRAHAVAIGLAKKLIDL
jgi:DNA-binding CsgD family transcriptional regulator